MNDNELELDLEDLDKIEASSENKLKVKNRFEKLSEKVILTAKEKEEALAKVKTEAEARSKVEKERDFYKDFSKTSSQYPQAASYQDKILEKVNAGYSVEDATITILAKEGKLQPITADTQPVRTDSAAGGSASTMITDSLEKRPSEMKQEERRNALIELEKQGMNILKF